MIRPHLLRFLSPFERSVRFRDSELYCATFSLVFHHEVNRGGWRMHGLVCLLTGEKRGMRQIKQSRNTMLSRRPMKGVITKIGPQHCPPASLVSVDFRFIQTCGRKAAGFRSIRERSGRVNHRSITGIA